MDLTKKLEAEIMKVYNTYWDAYLSGDMKTFASIFDDDCYIIGSSENEAFKTKKAALKFYKTTADQVAGKSALRNRKISLKPTGTGIMVIEHSDFFVLIDGTWTFYSQGRISTIFQKKNNTWKIIHQHGSIPDSKAGEGEQISIDKIKAENTQLRAAVKRRTVELEEKNQELEIEAALEKVRSRSLAMHKSNELQDVVRSVSERLQELNIEFYTAIIFIFIEGSRDAVWWLVNKKNQQHSSIVVKYAELAYFRNLFAAKENGKELFTACYSGEEKKEFYNYLLQQTDFKYIPEEQKDFLLGSEFATVSDALTKNIAIHLTRYSNNAFSEKDNEILKRFAKVFEQAYTRFIDLQKAEAQAREAQIEVSLERVRSKTMAMHNSQDVADTVATMFDELIKLGIETIRCGIGIIHESMQMEVWTARKNEKGKVELIIGWLNMIIHPLLQGVYEGWKNKETSCSYELKGDDLIKYFTALSNSPGYTIKYDMASLPAKQFHINFYFPEGALFAFSAEQLSAETSKIFKRFAGVFGQTYRRFLDLQKAEAQAREAKIEAALERVRSQSLAMHQSNDLQEVIKMLSGQLSVLGLKFDVANFIKLSKDDSWDMWISTPDQTYPAELHFPSFDHPVFTDVKQVAEKKENFFAGNYSFEVKNTFYKHFFENTAAKDIPEARKQYVFSGKGLALSVFPLKNILLFLANYQGIPFTDDENAMAKRFAIVFEQAYTRFLDLQKAEAQAREAKIEAALERVRSQSLAMHQSEQLHEVIGVVTEQFHELGFRFDTANFMTNFSKYDLDMWASTPGVPVPSQIKVPYTKIKFFDQIREAMQNKLEFLTTHFSKEEKNSFFRQFFTKTDAKYIPEKRKKIVFDKAGLAASTVLLNKVFLMIVNYDGVPYTEEENTIIKRFAKVFEQTYTRFLDLQKAEANVREAHIEAGLERVRARTMAMHSSEDVSVATATLLSELEKLNIQNLRGGILNIRQDETMEVWSINTLEDGRIVRAIGDFDMKMHPLWQQLYSSWRNKDDFFHFDMIGKDKEDYIRILDARRDYLPNGIQQLPDCNVQSYLFSEGAVWTYSLQAHSEDEKQIMKRFTSVFSLTFRRYQDLQKAEAQAREAKIETALEKVRSRTMAMQHSDELPAAANVLFLEVQALGIPAWSCGYNVLAEDKKTSDCWMSSEGAIQDPFTLYFTEEASFIKWYNFLLSEENFYVQELGGKDLEDHYNYMRNIPKLGEVIKKLEDAGISLPTYQINHLCKFNSGFLLFITYEPVPNAHDLFKRFTKVFEQTYTRFLDLQKAEAQAREAKIEAALEKVRSRSLAMHKSEELQEVVTVVFQRMKELDISMDAANIDIFLEGSRDADLWIASPGQAYASFFHLPYVDYQIPSDIFNAKEKGEDFFEKTYSFEQKNKYFNYLFEHSDFKHLPDIRKNKMLAGDAYTVSFAFTKKAAISIHSYSGKLFSEYENDILKRFAKVFEQAYTRFLDLQNAEAQSRESQIQLAMERVRARTMAMQKSDELTDAASLLFKQIADLGIKLWSTAFQIWNADDISTTAWASAPDGSMQEPFRLPYNEDIFFKRIYEARQSGKDFFVMESSGKELEETYHYMFNLPGVKKYFDDALDSGFAIPKFQITHCAFFAQGYVMFITYEPVPYTWDIFKRFAKVFEQTYTRFLDLQKAEAQAREATIEAALEKVRGKAMAMHNSNDLTATASMVFTELRKLGINSIRSGVGLLTKENRKVSLYAATSSEEGDHLSLVGWAMLQDHEVLSKIYNGWVRNEDYFPVLKGELLKSYYEKIKLNFVVPQQQAEYEQHGYFLQFSEGMFYGWSEKPYTESQIKILKRFASVVDLTFRRYIELQKSEANAREAVKQAALDRVRAEIASMRTVGDLEKITPLIWNELNILGIPFIRCGVFIMDELQQIIHTFLSTPDGKAIGAFHVPYDTSGNISLILRNWKQKEKYIDHWDEAAFTEFADTLVKQGAIASPEQYLKTLPKEGFYLHFLPFLQGMLYVGNTTQLSEDEINLIQSVADAFSTAYARYEDFNKLEAAKQQVDKTLVDLKQAQTQLVQSEKMASLGELTAGIAHEIQNPLNFVNNFSEVNKELIGEMKEEIEKGNYDEVKTIAKDIEDNEEKINHHGKRADTIVKGMLQHSRISNGVKEPTDINTLCDEYLRLSYHGLRAKDKSFNADLKTEFDGSMGKIDVIPQDIGRVILNLFNNAFYAVNEKKNLKIDGYEPTVFVSTKRAGDKVLISIKDNGNGIPQKVFEKVFQPFFTTKPTGQGTGLGLSLSYDIIKAHGGEIKVETKEGEGADFIIMLPLLNG